MNVIMCSMHFAVTFYFPLFTSYRDLRFFIFISILNSLHLSCNLSNILCNVFSSSAINTALSVYLKLLTSCPSIPSNLELEFGLDEVKYCILRGSSYMLQPVTTQERGIDIADIVKGLSVQYTVFILDEFACFTVCLLQIGKSDEYDCMFTCLIRAECIYHPSSPSKSYAGLRIHTTSNWKPSELLTNCDDGKAFICPRAFKAYFQQHVERALSRPLRCPAADGKTVGMSKANQLVRVNGSIGRWDLLQVGYQISRSGHTDHGSRVTGHGGFCPLTVYHHYVTSVIRPSVCSEIY